MPAELRLKDERRRPAVFEGSGIKGSNGERASFTSHHRSATNKPESSDLPSLPKTERRETLLVRPWSADVEVCRVQTCLKIRFRSLQAVKTTPQHGQTMHQVNPPVFGLGDHVWGLQGVLWAELKLVSL